MALSLAGLLFLAFFAALPFARLATTGNDALLPVYVTATVVLEVVTATLLLCLYRVWPSPGLPVLGCGYLFLALMAPAWGASFPVLGQQFGLDLGPHANAAVAGIRRTGFPLFIIAYALAPATPLAGWPTLRRGPALLAAMLVLLIGGAWLAGDARRLPILTGAVASLRPLVPPVALALYALGIALLIRRRRPLDLWVMLVLLSVAIELVLIAYLGAAEQFTVGWWAGRVYGLAAASFVLVFLILQTTRVYAQLAQTLTAERRARHDRLTAMEALSASIAHEINQPLASMVTNADAGLRWLGRAEPRLDMAEAALRRIVEDGHRASRIVAGIRTMFNAGTQERIELDLNHIVTQAIRQTEQEALLAGIDLVPDLDPDLPAVVGNEVQLMHLLRNLVENAIDSIRNVRERPRRVVVHTRQRTTGEVRIEVADTGTGIAPEVAERLFDPFVSTKPGGMGMGLMFCRAVAESHGGRLWATNNVPRGAIFHLRLPAAMLAALPGNRTEARSRTRTDMHRAGTP